VASKYPAQHTEKHSALHLQGSSTITFGVTHDTNSKTPFFIVSEPAHTFSMSFRLTGLVLTARKHLSLVDRLVNDVLESGRGR